VTTFYSDKGPPFAAHADREAFQKLQSTQSVCGISLQFFDGAMGKTLFYRDRLAQAQAACRLK
jgi:hypothetical protein